VFIAHIVHLEIVSILIDNNHLRRKSLRTYILSFLYDEVPIHRNEIIKHVLKKSLIRNKIM